MMHIDDIRRASVERMLEALGERLKREKKRRRLGTGRAMTDAELARLAGVSRSTITRLWQGDPIGTDNLIRVLRALNRLDLLYGLVVEEGPSPLERLQPQRRRRHPERGANIRPSADDLYPDTPLADVAALREKYTKGGQD